MYICYTRIYFILGTPYYIVYLSGLLMILSNLSYIRIESNYTVECRHLYGISCFSPYRSAKIDFFLIFLK